MNMSGARPDLKAVILLALAAGTLTVSFYLPVANLFLMGDGGNSTALKQAQAYLADPLFWHSVSVTLQISLWTTAASLILAVPAVLFIIHCNNLAERLLIAVVVASLFSSILLRTFVWFVLLGHNGPVVALISALGGDHTHTPLLFTQFAVILGMTHILLPTAILTMWSRMRTTAHQQLRLAKMLGAPTFYYFLRIALPAGASAIATAALLIFVLSLGFAITPILLGGGGGQTMMIGVLIDEQVNRFGNWDRGAALSILLIGLIGAAATVIFASTRAIRVWRGA